MRYKYFLGLVFFCETFSGAAQQNSENGFSIPVQTAAMPLKILFVFAEELPPCEQAGQAGWSPGSLPDNVNTYFDAFLPAGGPTTYITKYYYDASFGQFVLLGDYLNQVIQVPCAPGVQTHAAIFKIDSILKNTRPGTFGNPNTTLSDFDKYTLPKPYAGIAKPAVANNRIDGLIIFWRNSEYGCGSGGALQPSWYTPIGPFEGADNVASFGMCGALMQKKFVLQEIFHAMFGGNNWHSGAGADEHTFFTNTNAWGLCTQTQSSGMSNVVCAWDRYHLGWKNPPDKNILISARDGDNINLEAATDLDIVSKPNSSASGTYILRDFVTYGDAIQIKLPHINWQRSESPVKNQYLWLENHQLRNEYDHSTNYTEHVGATCSADWAPGIYALLQIGKDQKNENLIPNIYSGENSHPNGLGSWLFPLTANGNYDYVYGPNMSECDDPCGWCTGSTIVDKHNPLVKANPFTGWSEIYGLPNGDTSDYINDTGGDAGTNMGECIEPGDYSPSNILWSRTLWGNDRVAFRCDNGCPPEGKKILSIATNPAPTPVYTFMSNMSHAKHSSPRQPYENEIIWLSGLSVTLLEENIGGAGAVKIKVRWDDYDVDRDVRWCGAIMLSPNDFNPQLPSLMVLKGKTILLDRGKSPTEQQVQEIINGEKYFTVPTVFTCLANSYIHLGPKAKLIVGNNSKLILKAGSKLVIEKGARLIVRKGSTLVVEEGVQLVVRKGGKVSK